MSALEPLGRDCPDGAFVATRFGVGFAFESTVRSQPGSPILLVVAAITSSVVLVSNVIPSRAREQGVSSNSATTSGVKSA